MEEQPATNENSSSLLQTKERRKLQPRRQKTKALNNLNRCSINILSSYLMRMHEKFSHFCMEQHSPSPYRTPDTRPERLHPVSTFNFPSTGTPRPAPIYPFLKSSNGGSENVAPYTAGQRFCCSPSSLRFQSSTTQGIADVTNVDPEPESHYHTPVKISRLSFDGASEESDAFYPESPCSPQDVGQAKKASVYLPESRPHQGMLFGSTLINIPDDVNAYECCKCGEGTDKICCSCKKAYCAFHLYKAHRVFVCKIWSTTDPPSKEIRMALEL
jgi:hypothetical protein